MKKIEFNMNHYVHVKLTKDGRYELRRQHEMILGGRFEYREPVEDEEGWSRWQLHSLMSSLGYRMTMGGPPPFETIIRFEMEDAE